MPNGHVDSSRSSDEDRTDIIKRCLFFTHDVVKFGRFIMDQTNVDFPNDVNYEPLVKDETTHLTVMPKFSYKIKMSFDGKTVLGFSSNSNYLDTTILESLEFFLF